MKLIIKRNQADVKGMFGGHKGVSFSLSGRCEITADEKALLAKYKAGQSILASFKSNSNKQGESETMITADGIISGITVETADILKLRELEENMKQGCQNLKSLLEVMASFGGEETFEI